MSGGKANNLVRKPIMFLAGLIGLLAAFWAAGLLVFEPKMPLNYKFWGFTIFVGGSALALWGAGEWGKWWYFLAIGLLMPLFFTMSWFVDELGFSDKGLIAGIICCLIEIWLIRRIRNFYKLKRALTN